MPLFNIQGDDTVNQIKSRSFPNERVLQRLFENNLLQLLGVQFIASEFTTGDRQRGRIDSLGLDQDGYPTIIEYKKTSKENVINQGLFYLDWLVDHKGDFEIAAQKVLGSSISIDWSSPRLILVAETFSEYDKYAVNRIGANIDLWSYGLYGDNLLYLDPLFVTNPQVLKTSLKTKITAEVEPQELPTYTLDHHIKGKSSKMVDLYQELRDHIFTFAEEGEIVEKFNKMYIGYKHGKNFCEVRIQTAALKVWLDIPLSELKDQLGLVRDVSDIGHYGTGQVEMHLSNSTDINNAVPLIEQSFLQTI